MWQRLQRWLSAGATTDAGSDAPGPLATSIHPPIDAVPSPHRFESFDAWLQAWIAWRLGHEPERCRCAGPFGDGFIIGGTIGLVYAFARDGVLWIFREGGFAEGQVDTWFEASTNQRVAILIDAQRRVYPELALLLPLRPAAAVDCADCGGRAYDIAWCGACSNRGWTLAGLDTSLPPIFRA